MLVSRRAGDAVAAGFVGCGVVLIATGVKPVPSVISYLGVMGYLWGALMLLGSIAALVGSLLRTRDLTATRRRYVSVMLERSGWPLIAGCAFVFCLGVLYQYGVIDAALTLGWSGFTIATCWGHWRDLQPPKGSVSES